MKKFTLEILLISFIVFSFVDCQVWNPHSNGRTVNGRKASRNGGYHSEEGNGGKSSEINHLPAKSQPVKQSPRGGGGGGGGIGAWGYVSIILFVILSGLGIYYTILFYPIVCKKQRMYHVMGSTTV